MKHLKWLLCVLCVLCLAGCGAKAPGDSLPEEGITEMPKTEYVLPEDGQEGACSLVEKDGVLQGFELRFPQSKEADACFRDPKNYYFGVLDSGKKQYAVPTENIRILTDIETNEFVVTLLCPKEEKLSGKECTVSLAVSPREGGTNQVLFSVSGTVELP